MTFPRALLVASLAAFAPAALDAQQAQAPAPPNPAPSSASQAPAAPEPPASGYTYQPDGRRDPFLTLIGTGIEPRSNARRAEGASGLLVSEISVRGIVQSRGDLVAMVHGADNKTYIVHAGDKLADGTIKSITQQGLVIVQEVNDPLSLVKQREIRKLLRSLEDGKE